MGVGGGRDGGGCQIHAPACYRVILRGSRCVGLAVVGRYSDCGTRLLASFILPISMGDFWAIRQKVQRKINGMTHRDGARVGAVSLLEYPESNCAAVVEAGIHAGLSLQ